MSEQDENTVTLMPQEVKEESPVTEEMLKNEGLSREEIEQAREFEILKEENEDAEHQGEQSDAQGELRDSDERSQGNERKRESEDDETSEADTSGHQQVSVEEYDTFDKVHDLYNKDVDKFRSLPPNVKNLYHNSKALYKKSKLETQKRQDLEKKMNFELLRNKGAEMKLDRIKEALGQDNVTVEQLEAVLNEQNNVSRETTENESSREEKNTDDSEKQRQEFIQERMIEADKIGQSEYDNFKEIVDMATEVTQLKPRHLKTLQDALVDEDVSEKDLVDLVVDIARLNPKYGQGQASKDVPKNEKVDRMLKNSKKSVSSAALGAGRGGNVKTYDELTPEDILSMDQKTFNSLPSDVTERLMRQI